MYYKLYKDGTFVNKIKADPEFADFYCRINGFTYEEEEEPHFPDPEPEPEEPTEEDDVNQMLVDHEYRILMLELGLTE